MELEWKQLKQVHFLCVQLVEHAMVDVKQFQNHVMNVQEKEKLHKNDLQLYQYQLVNILYIQKIDLTRKFYFSGVEDGQTMRVNLGSSEVFITFRVKTSEKFRRDKEDIHSEVNLSIVQAILGGAIKVPGIYEDHLLQVTLSYHFFKLNK
jgi:hypothetical protein